MEDIRGSLSKLKKGVKHRLKASKRKANKPGAGGGGSGSNADNKNAEPSAVEDEGGLDWGSIVSSTAKSLLRGVRDSADALPALKSVAGGLCFILDNYEVRFPPYRLFTKLTCTAANEGKQTGGRIVGTPGQGTCGIALQTCF
jgi:hypothetical protein